MLRLFEGHPPSDTEIRRDYCDALIDLARGDARIVSVDCDLAYSVGTAGFADAFPERSFNLGIMEANALGVCAGMSAAGLVPFFHSFAAFSSRRVFDQAFISCAYAGQNVKIIGGDAGVTATYNGGTHMAFEDMALMRTIPGAQVYDIADAALLRALLPQMASRRGVDYMRMPRKGFRRIYEDGCDALAGEANLLRDGTDITIIACGIMVHEALMAAQALAGRGVSARVVDMFTVKPLDEDCVIDCARATGGVVTAENHSVTGGLGSAVAELLAESFPVPTERVGVREEFGEVGDQEYLMKRFGLTAGDICDAAARVLARKRGNAQG